MSYEHRSNIHRRKISTPLKIIISAGIVLCIVNIIAPQFLSAFFTKILRPFWGQEKPITVSFELTDATVKELQKENAELKLALGHASSSDSIMASILKKPPFSAYDIYIIDIGKKAGIMLGDKVYAPGHILIGEIAEINSDTSKVKLYSSYGNTYNVFIGDYDIEVNADGKGGGSFEAIVPRDSGIVEGDTVTIAGLDNRVFGIVRKVLINPAKTFSTILFSQPINMYEQRIVLIERASASEKIISLEKSTTGEKVSEKVGTKASTTNKTR